jgi:hypothetical protein
VAAAAVAALGRGAFSFIQKARTESAEAERESKKSHLPTDGFVS